MNDEPIKHVLDIEIKALDDLISKELLLCDSIVIQDVSKYIVFAGGKRVRPHLLLLMSKLFAAHEQGHQIKLAAALELIHTATLLHDDIVDNSNMRRNKTAAHLVWGLRDCVTTGNWLFALAFKLSVACQNIELTRIISEMTKAMAQGELNQLAYKDLAAKNDQNRCIIDEASYFEIISAKTGILFAAATELAAVLNNQSQNIIKIAKQFGMHLGLAFQIKDDLLDYMGDVDTLGKNIGDDLIEGKITLPLILLRERKPEVFNDLMINIQNYSQGDPEFLKKFQEIRQILHENNCVQDSYKKAQDEQEQALCYLNQLPQNAITEYLRKITLDAVTRSH